VTLPKLDLNDPDSLAAFASPDSFDSQDMLLEDEEEDEIMSIEEGDDGEWRVPQMDGEDEEEEEEDLEEDEDLFDETGMKRRMFGPKRFACLCGKNSCPFSSS
jgi:hypothetical protein